MNVLSLFDGMSCGRIALERIGLSVDKYFASEVDEYAIKVAMHNYPDTVQIGDVSKVKAEDLPQIDLLIGGSPCQGFSTSGKGLNFEDSRSKLFFEYVRLLKECNPTYFLLENVHMKKDFRDIISEYLGVEPIEINSALVSGQNRPRFYWTNIPGVTQPEDKGILASDVLGIEGARLGQYQPHPRDYKKRGLKRKERLEYRTDGKSNAVLTSSKKNILFNEENPRRLTPSECEKLQTLPDNYTDIGISNTQRYKMIGNGWTVDVIAHIFKGLL